MTEPNAPVAAPVADEAPAPQPTKAAPLAAPVAAPPASPAPSSDPYLQRIDALLKEYEQQKRRTEMIATAAKAELVKFEQSEGGQMITVKPLTDAVARLFDELVETHLSLGIDHLKLLKQAAEEDEQEMQQYLDEGGDDEGGDEGEMDSVLIDQDAAFILGTLDQYRVLLEQTLPQQPDGEAKRTLSRLLLQCKQALELVESISVYTSEEPDDGTEPNASS